MHDIFVFLIALQKIKNFITIFIFSETVLYTGDIFLFYLSMKINVFYFFFTGKT